MIEQTEKRYVADDNLTIEERVEALVTEGQVVPGDHGVFEDGREIPWLDMDLAQSGQDFFQKNYAAIILGHALYFGLGFGFKPITSMVVRTRGFHGVEQTTKRLMSTLWHLLRWYECDIVGRYAEGYKAIARIRKTHATLRRKHFLSMRKGTELYLDEDEEPLTDPVTKALKVDLAFLDTSLFDRMDLTYNPPEPMSQLSLAITQLGFLLPIFAHPESFGLKDLDGAEGFEHMWALIGHLSGLEDRFNLPLHRPGKAVYTKILYEIFLPSFLVRDSKVVAIQDSFYNSNNSYPFMPTLGVAAGLYVMMKDLKEFDGKALRKSMPWRDWMGVVIVRFFLWLMSISVFVRVLVNRVTKNMIEKVLENYNREQIDQGSDLTTLPKSTNWSEKYRKRSETVLQKWKKTEALVDLMSTKNIRSAKHAQLRKDKAAAARAAKTSALTQN